MAEVPVTMTVRHRDEIGRFASEVDEGCRKSANDGAKLGAQIARGLAPRHSGALAATIQAHGNQYSTGALKYAMPQEEGAGSHDIGAEGQVLVNREENFRAIGPVRHPGNPAVRFMHESLAIVSKAMIKIIRSNMP